MMSLEGTLSPITKGEFPLTLSSYSCQSKFVRKALKFLTSSEIQKYIIDTSGTLLFLIIFEFIKKDTYKL